MFSRMDELEKTTRLPVNFLYTHPTSQTRIEVRPHLFYHHLVADLNGNFISAIK